MLPTRYAVEAQPLVLLEAMASGCAIVTTTVGEIPTILDEECAAFLRAGAASELGSVLAQLVSEPAKVRRLARAAHQRYVERYQLSQHLDGWENRLSQVSAVTGQGAALVAAKP